MWIPKSLMGSKRVDDSHESWAMTHIKGGGDGGHAGSFEVILRHF